MIISCGIQQFHIPAASRPIECSSQSRPGRSGGSSSRDPERPGIFLLGKMGTYGGFHSHGGTVASSHPFKRMGFSINHPAMGIPPWPWKPPYGTTWGNFLSKKSRHWFDYPRLSLIFTNVIRVYNWGRRPGSFQGFCLSNNGVTVKMNI